MPELPVVLKPRFGSWGGDVTLCRTHDEVQTVTARLYTENGVLAQELVPSSGWDERVAWWPERPVHTAVPRPHTRVLAADAVHADLAGVDLLPTRSGWVIAEMNWVVDFRPWYGENVFDSAIVELVRVAHERRAAA